MSLLSDMLELIKKAALEAVNANYPVRVMFARLSGTNPVTVYINQKLPAVGGSFLEVTQGFAERLRDGTHAVCVGDTVALLQMQGGQKFLLIDKVV